MKRMNGFNLPVARKVFCIEGQDSLHSVDTHCRNQPRILHLNSGDAIVHQQTPPFLMNCESLRQQPETGLNCDCSPIRLCRRKSVSVSVSRTSQDVPEFAKVL